MLLLPPQYLTSPQLAFSSRVRIYHACQGADAHLRRTKQTHESTRAQGRLASDQLSRSLAIVAEAERRALDAKQEFDQVSRLVKTEVARFEQERIEDFKNSLSAYLEGMIARQKQVRLLPTSCCKNWTDSFSSSSLLGRATNNRCSNVSRRKASSVRRIPLPFPSRELYSHFHYGSLSYCSIGRQ